MGSVTDYISIKNKNLQPFYSYEVDSSCFLQYNDRINNRPFLLDY